MWPNGLSGPQTIECSSLRAVTLSFSWRHRRGCGVSEGAIRFSKGSSCAENRLMRPAVDWPWLASVLRASAKATSSMPKRYLSTTPSLAIRPTCDTRTF